MKTAAIIAAIFFGSLAILAVVLGIWGVGIYNSAKTLRNQYEVKDKANSAIFDNMWKSISQSVQVTDMQKDALQDIFVKHAEARTTGGSQDGSLMKWVQESIPNLDQATVTYRNLQNIITGARDTWTANQVALVAIAGEYNKMLEVFPSNFVLKLFGFEKINARVITSSRTENAYATGKDDDVKLRP